MDADRCVCCGEIVPEGTMVCWNCEHNVLDNRNTSAQSNFEIVKPYNNKIFAKIINTVCRIFDVLRRCHIDCTK